MRPPAKIKPWLSLPELTEWVCAASADASLLRKRLVVWLLALQPSHARQVAVLLGVSVVSVWRWVGRYNRGGPQALGASRRGGRRRGHLASRAAESRVLAGLEPRAFAGDLLTAGPLRQALEQAAGHRLPTSTLYALLARQDWRKLAPRPRHPRTTSEALEAYKKTSRLPGKPPRPSCA
ncbi:MAG: winged helix-turn-helix domain-containing protein [Verrucomicrobia bacterium]|nr:winged helix-turn-helix domain-containing protein [Verrucomicrobiota bacterium]